MGDIQGQRRESSVERGRPVSLGDIAVPGREILKLPGMLMVGASGSNVGKTELACAVISKFAGDHDILGLKVTTVARRDGRRQES